MTPQESFPDVFRVILDLSSTISKKIDDYKNNIENNPSIKRAFYNIDFVYMHSIVLDMGKLLSVNNNDRSGLRGLEKSSPDKFKKDIRIFRDKYKDVIEKIKSNRNRIISHVDISDEGHFSKMGFSEKEVNKKVTDLNDHFTFLYGLNKSLVESSIEHWNKLRSESIRTERYSPSDFSKEVDIFIIMIREIVSISYKINVCYCEKTRLK